MQCRHSDNCVVGYQNKEIATGWSLQTPTFQTIGLEGMSIQNIIPNGDDVAGGGEIYFMVLKKDRKTQVQFSWQTIEDDDAEADGWYNDFTGEFAEYTFKPGDAFMLYAPYNLSFQMAGQVKNGASPVNMTTAGWYVIGNPTPKSVDIQSLIPTGDDVLGGGEIYFMVLKADRKTKVQFSWQTIEDDDAEADGWYNDFTGEFAEYSIGAGDSVMLYAPYAMTITFPTALAD